MKVAPFFTGFMALNACGPKHELIGVSGVISDGDYTLPHSVEEDGELVGSALDGIRWRIQQIEEVASRGGSQRCVEFTN